MIPETKLRPRSLCRDVAPTQDEELIQVRCNRCGSVLTELTQSVAELRPVNEGYIREKCKRCKKYSRIYLPLIEAHVK